ncbi:Calx-beta domain-containing protein [Pseudoalteromonas denitrificans DSM 6059]|uniref:Calx-beta domain-containing protein n=2 Tax=Pseudoalteromonas TaxID=53246 RepID=A0A1I1DWL5_9GAMM|nr:Calx-beta domain-containing protein [Pseudoalteromonas denitrificans DSM 6059]
MTFIILLAMFICGVSSQSANAAPVISSVTLSNSVHKVGDNVTISIFADQAGLTLVSGSVNGVNLSAFTDTGGGNYTASYIIIDGGNDIATGSDIPVNLILEDASNVQSNNYITPISQTADAIYANLPDINLTVSANSLVENSGSVNVIATLSGSLNNQWPAAITANLTYSGTATVDVDYTKSDSILIPQNNTSSLTSITGRVDNLYDAAVDESVTITLNTVSVGTVGTTNQQTVTIVDAQSAPVVTLSVATNSVSEVGGTSNITATLSNESFQDVVVNLAFSGTAASGAVDYNTPSNSITISGGSLSANAATGISTVNNELIEGNKTIIIDIASVVGGSENGVQQQTITILDDETANVSLSLSVASIAEAAGFTQLTATINKVTFQDVVVSLAYSGTAISGIDYVTPNLTITITQGQTTGSATITAIQDTDEEADESIIIDVTSVTGGVESGIQQQTISILDDDNQTQADVASVNEDNQVLIDVLSNDGGAGNELNPASVTVVTATTHGVTSVNTVNGIVTYTPDENYFGTDTFTYVVTNLRGTISSETAVAITINSVNDAPIAVNDTTSVAEDNTVVISVLSNDTDVDNATEIKSSSLAITTQPEHGQATISNGQISYKANADYNGSDFFGYTVSDVFDAVSNVATVSINVSGSNDAPRTTDDTATIAEDSVITIKVLENDQDIDGTLDITSIALVATPLKGDVQVQLDGSVIYTPNKDFFGLDTFTYTVKDNENALSLATRVNINVTAVNDAPVSANDIVVLKEDVAHTINAIGNDVDVDGAITSILIMQAPTQGSVIVDEATLLLTYTPNANFFGTDTFTYQTADSLDAKSNTATVLLTVETVNDNPLSNNDEAQTDEEVAVSINVLENDQDIDGELVSQSIIIVTPPKFGTTEVHPSGKITYTPQVDYAGEDFFVYQVSDDQGGVASATVLIQVNNINDAPVALNQAIESNEDDALVFELTGTDVDKDNLVYSLITSPTQGVLTGEAPNLIYQPNENYFGNDSFTFKVNDGTLDSTEATISINILSVNDAPAGNEKTVLAAEDQTTNIVLTGSDVEGDDITFALVTSTKNGTLTGDVPNLAYTPFENYFGEDSFSFEVNDGKLTSTIVNMHIDVKAVNDIPVGDKQSLNVQEDTSISFKLTGSDIDSSVLTFKVIKNPPNGIVSGQPPYLAYTPDGDYNGNDSFTFEVQDGSGKSKPVVIDVTVEPVNDAPLAINDTVSRIDWQAVNIMVLNNDSDIDGDSLKIVGANTKTGSVTWVDSILTYTPAAGFNGSAVVEYQISDGFGGLDSALVLIDINVPSSELPKITPPNDIEADASGLFTQVDIGVATAVDKDGNSLPVTLVDNNTFFKPGVSTVFWQAIDENNQTVVISQKINMAPLISLSKEQKAVEGFAVKVDLMLNGLAPRYPLSIPYKVSGTAETFVDHDLTNGTLVIESGTHGEIAFNVFTDELAEEDETVIIELGSGVNRSEQYIHTVTISENTILPKVRLMVEQNAQQGSVVNKQTGTVLVSAKVEHPDHDKKYQYKWTNTELLLTDNDDSELTFSFDPSTLNIQNYQVNLELIDLDSQKTIVTKQITIHLDETAATLTSADTDLDGIPDNVEGQLDRDQDGIVDYLDAINECNVLPSNIASVTNFLIEGQSGGCLRLGNRAFKNQITGALIENGAIDDIGAQNTGGVYDFIVEGLSPDGQSYKVVFPQLKPIPANALYRKQVESGDWQDFVLTSTDKVFSTAGEYGYCPPPGEGSWQLGLISGFWCVQVQISDGGPNDADHKINGTIVDPSGVAVIFDGNHQPIAEDDSAQTRINTEITIDVLLNDSDRDNDLLIINPASAVLGNVSVIENKLNYKPAIDFVGTEVVVYAVSDGKGGTDFAEVTIAVSANKTPIAQDDAADTFKGESVIIIVLSNDTDPDGDSLSLVSASASNGNVAINNDGSLTYIPNSEFIGVDEISYRIKDVFNAQANGIVKVTVSEKEEVTPESEKSDSGGALFWLLMLITLIKSRKAFKI